MAWFSLRPENSTNNWVNTLYHMGDELGTLYYAMLLAAESKAIFEKDSFMSKMNTSHGL